MSVSPTADGHGYSVLTNVSIANDSYSWLYLVGSTHSYMGEINHGAADTLRTGHVSFLVNQGYESRFFLRSVVILMGKRH